MANTLSVTLAQINPTVGAIPANVGKICSILRQHAGKTDVVVFPEMSIPGYPIEDLVFYRAFRQDCEAGLTRIREVVAETGVAAIVGLPHQNPDGKIYNAAAFVTPNRGVEIITKTERPNIGQFDEVRTYAADPASNRKYLIYKGFYIALMICEDMWHPHVAEVLSQPDLTIVINGSPFEIGKDAVRLELAEERMEQTGYAPFFYVNLTGCQDQIVFDGRSFACRLPGDAETPEAMETYWLPLCEEATRTFLVRKTDFIGRPVTFLTFPEEPSEPAAYDPLETIYKVIHTAAYDYPTKNGFGDDGCVFGISGGIDSALTAAIMADALGADKVTLLMMPSEFSSEGSITDSQDIAGRLGIADLRLRPIKDVMQALKATLAEDFGSKTSGIAIENLQVRTRVMLVMGVSNDEHKIAIQTVNRPEVALGYFTLGETAGFALLKDLAKTTIYDLARWRNQNHRPWMRGPAGEVIPQAIIDKVPSAELAPGQKDSDSLPPYDVLDDLVRLIVVDHLGVDEIVAVRGYDHDMVQRVVTMKLRAEHKRGQAPLGPKVTRANFGRDHRMPITNHYREGAAV